MSGYKATLKLIAAFLTGIIFICLIQYFYNPAAKWWSREIYDCGIRVAHGMNVTGVNFHGKNREHKYGVCID